MMRKGFLADAPQLIEAQQAEEAVRRLNDRIRYLATRGTGYATPSPPLKVHDHSSYRLGYPRKDTH